MSRVIHIIIGIIISTMIIIFVPLVSSCNFCYKCSLELKRKLEDLGIKKDWKIIYSDGIKLYSINLDGGIKLLFEKKGYALYHPSLSHDGEQIVCIGEDLNSVPRKRYLLHYTLGSNELEILLSNMRVSYPKFAPDGEKISFLSNFNLSTQKYDLMLYDNKKRKTRILLRGEFLYENGFSIDWSPNSEYIVYSSIDGFVKVLNIDTLNIEEIIEGDAPSWSPSGFISFREGQFHYELLRNGGTKFYTTGNKYFKIDIQKNKKEFLLNGDVRLNIFGCNSGYRLPLIWSPEGNFVLFYQFGRARFDISEVYTIYVMEIETDQVAKLTSIDGPIHGVSWK